MNNISGHRQDKNKQMFETVIKYRAKLMATQTIISHTTSLLNAGQVLPNKYRATQIMQERMGIIQRTISVTDVMIEQC